MTGTPSNVDDSTGLVNKFVKGQDGYEDIVKHLMSIFDTGLTRIFGGRGKIEEFLSSVFWENILPNLSEWEGHAKKGIYTEEALLRFTINHLFEHLTNNDEKHFIQEMYISPPISKDYKTGSIIQHKETEQNYVILTPACDLVIRKNGNIKTDRILICEIEDFVSVFTDFTSEENSKNTKKIKDNLLGNNFSDYYHWLPPTSSFEGGLINFRWIYSVFKTEFEEEFHPPKQQISPHFIKDIVSRFSSYYARQGQPDFDIKALSKHLYSTK